MKRLTPVSLPLTLSLALLLPGSVRAERTQVFSIQGADCADCSERIKTELDKVKGVKKVEFDKMKVELTVRLEDAVADDEVLAAAERAGLKAVVGAGQGAYLPPPDYPAGADVVRLTNDGQAVGPLKKLRVPGKHTVFDVYADWCGPCRLVDEALRTVVGKRSDVAVRKLNVVDFDSPLARELGSSFEALPYVVVFSPTGKRTEIRGANLKKLEEALARP
jgi:copper chaperone CopZ/thiol-disulfide isomerase/thioredoxin